MANTITKLIERIEDYRATNKNPCKNYATEAAAEKATAAMAKACAEYYSDNENEKACPYVVFYVPAWGRWCGAVNHTRLLNKYGGYAGFPSTKNFFSYCE